MREEHLGLLFVLLREPDLSLYIAAVLEADNTRLGDRSGHVVTVTGHPSKSTVAAKTDIKREVVVEASIKDEDTELRVTSLTMVSDSCK